MRTQLEVSLKRLNQDYTDIFFLHRFDEDTLWRNLLKRLKGPFAFRFSAWQVMKAQGLALRHGFPVIELLQPMYNLVKRQAEVELLPMASAEDIGVISYSPLGGGLLTGKYIKKAQPQMHDSAGIINMLPVMVKPGCIRQLISCKRSPNKPGLTRSTCCGQVCA